MSLKCSSIFYLQTLYYKYIRVNPLSYKMAKINLTLLKLNLILNFIGKDEHENKNNTFKIFLNSDLMQSFLNCRNSFVSILLKHNKYLININD